MLISSWHSLSVSRRRSLKCPLLHTQVQKRPVQIFCLFTDALYLKVLLNAQYLKYCCHSILHSRQLGLKRLKRSRMIAESEYVSLPVCHLPLHMNGKYRVKSLVHLVQYCPLGLMVTIQCLGKGLLGPSIWSYEVQRGDSADWTGGC